MESTYKKWNNIIGWLIFLIASFVYLSTIEPTASFWDCGEFLAAAHKQEVGHPPGAPFFIMVARVFSFFMPPEKVAAQVNRLSALCSAFTILFLFWSITALLRKISFKNEENISIAKIIAVLGSGAVGALAYTFSDSFWFSAEEAEVYAMSSFFTAIIFWAILKWERNADKAGSIKYLVLISYLMGLSIGVHLLNLLAIPAITFVYYFKRFKTTRNGIIIAFIISIIILATVQYGIISGLVILASKFELFFVNSIGLPFNSGVLIYALLLLALISWGLYKTHKNKNFVANTILLSFLMIIIGYSSYITIVIRSNANTPLDENDPQNVFSLLSYLNREQYGDRPLLYGQYFNTPLDPFKPYKDGSPVYYPDKKKGKYIIVDDRKESIPNYDKRFCTIFPRMYSTENDHIKAYKQWSDFKGIPMRANIGGQIKIINKPTFWENIKFFIRYQLGHMYWRYFMWNFSGRQNDIQGHGGILHGNWITGIPFIDSLLIAPQNNLPQSMINNKAYNRYFMLPFLLGLLGLYFHFKNEKKGFTIVSLFFFFTGIAIIIYLNQYPYQPRERDYAYVGSFYAYAIWIGFGVYAIFDYIRKKLPDSISAILSTVFCLFAVPVVMAHQNWDDHDRSGRYTARDFAKNYLESCAKNAILFTNGDNDTFPLWYVQEVEEFRTDVRVVNLSLLNTDWYITQMKRKAYDSDPVPFSLTEEQYRQGTRDYLPILDKFKDYKNLKDVMDFVASDDIQTKIPTQSGKYLDYLPTRKFIIPVDSEQVISTGTVSKEDAKNIVKEIKWTLGKRRYIFKKDLMILDLIAHNNWKRPVYFAVTTGSAAYIGLQKYFQLEGLAYRFVPILAKSKDGQTGRVKTDIMYNNLMNKFKWGGMDKGDIYLDENNLRMCMNLRNNFARLANALLDENKKDSALKVLYKCLEVMPEKNVPYNYFMLPVIEAFYRAGDYKKANELAKRLMDIYEDNLNYYLSLPNKYRQLIDEDIQRSMMVVQRLTQLTNSIYPQEKLGKEFKKKLQNLSQLYMTSK